MGQGQSQSSASGLTLKSLAQSLSNGDFKNVIVMCGAGISTSAGVPDFRSPSFGLYNQIRKVQDLPYPEAIFEGAFFQRNPVPFYTLVRSIFPQRLCPTDTHKFFALLHQKGILRRVYTQNIDALEVLGGAPEEKVIEAHGTFRESFCQACDAKYELSWLKDQIFKPETNDGVPKCTKCATGVVRPSVVFFGETLPRRFWENLDADFKQCDCLIVMGTSLAVAPFNALIARPPKTATRVFINKTKPGAVGFAGWMMGLGRNSVTFTNANDLVILDDCDKTVREICRQVNWEQELDALQVRILEP
eukprot:04000.XXX_89324_88357_1 [CDS] Oithona nana genome sequencing.